MPRHANETDWKGGEFVKTGGWVVMTAKILVRLSTKPDTDEVKKAKNSDLIA